MYIVSSIHCLIYRPIKHFLQHTYTYPQKHKGIYESRKQINMKQKIVVKVSFDCDKCRRKALKIAAAAQGVNSVSIEGIEKDLVVVIGDGVDSVCLTKLLRKKFRHANIVSVQEVKNNDKGKKKEDEYYCNNSNYNSNSNNNNYSVVPYCNNNCYTPHQHPPYPISSCYYDPYPTSNCYIL